MLATARILCFFMLGIAAMTRLAPAGWSQTHARVQDVSMEDPAGIPVVTATAATETIQIDGRLDESAWAQGVIADRFFQLDPLEGMPATERTEAIVLYDSDAIYVGARLFDSAPDSIIARLGRRDANQESDFFGVMLDPYLDRRSGYYFGLNAAGTLYDGVLMNDNSDDSDWDGVWQGRIQRTSYGWTAEMRIPYSQLRFYQQDRYVWGVNFMRGISRKQERAYLVYTPSDESGFVSRFPELVGIRDISPSRQLEIIPYVTSRASYDQTAGEGNPFNDGSVYGLDGGVDVRYALTSNLTMNATVNPDFGQVEVDPAVINLSDYETYFSEKRPFFVEGASVFGDFGMGGPRFNLSFNNSPSFFYSRRIGRSPAGRLPGHAFSDMPDGTRILGATKVVGKLAGNWNVETLQALTGREHARLQSGTGVRSEAEVEPTTYYGVYRAQKEFTDGRHGLGFISTVNQRFFSDERLMDQMNKRSLSFGVDGWTFLDRENTWVLNGWAGLSHLNGTEQRLLDIQRSSLHYFQRPDVDHVRIDSSATSLSGWAGRIGLSKERGRLTFSTAIEATSPSFDVNDAGFQSGSDAINGHIGLGYSWNDPTRFTRDAFVLAALFRGVDFSGNAFSTGAFVFSRIEFLNYYTAFGRFFATPETMTRRRTRGGPLTLEPGGVGMDVSLSSDRRKKFVVGLGVDMERGESGKETGLEVDIEWQAAPNIALALSPSVSWETEETQWVGAFDDPLAARTFGKRYVFAKLDQITLASTVRLNWTFTPELSFQLYAQPLVAVGDYSEYKELARSRSYDFVRYGEAGSTFDAETLVADPDGPGGLAETIELPNRDFNIASLRGTAVARWEYRPGSTLYLVWTQQRSDFTNDPYFDFGPSFNQLATAPMQNVFVLKMNWWFSS